MPDAPKSPPTLANQVSRAVVWNTFFVPLRMFAEIAATALKLTVLPIAAYGLLALVSGAASAFGTWIDLGTTRTLPKYIPETMRARGPNGVLKLLGAVFLAQAIFLIAIGIGLAVKQDDYLVSLSSKISADGRIDAGAQTMLHALLDEQGWIFIVVIIVLLIMGVCYDVLMAYLNSFFKQQAWNGISLIAGMLPQLLAVIAIVAAQFSPDPLRWSIVGILITSGLAPTIAVAIATWQVIIIWRAGHDVAPALASIEPSTKWLPVGFLRYTGVSYLMTMTDFIAGKSFAIYLTASISDAAMLWAGASLVGMVLSYLYTPLVGITVPLFTRVRAGEGGSIQGAFASIVRIQLLLLIPGGAALMLLAKPALLILTPQYGAAVGIVYILVPCLFLESILTVAHNVMIVYEQLTIVTVGRLLTLVVVPLGLWLSPRYGVEGLAFAYGFARVIAGIWVTIWGWQRLKLQWPWRFTVRVIIATIVMSISIYACSYYMPVTTATTGVWERLQLLPIYGLIGVVNLALFMGVLRLCGGLDSSDREQLLRLKLPFKSTIMRVL